MKKTEPIIEDIYRITENDLERCAKVAADAFIDDESSKFLLSSKLTKKNLYEFYAVLYKAVYKKMYMFADCENLNGFIIFSPLNNAEITLWEFIKAGGLKVIFSIGLNLVLRSLEYERNCVNIRKKFISPSDWYLFQFGVAPLKQGMGLGSKIIKPVLNWFDSQKIACYLETHKNVNVEIYSHLGFSLKDVGSLPNKYIKQFAMLRNV
jgi:hypothetical protein